MPASSPKTAAHRSPHTVWDTGPTAPPSPKTHSKAGTSVLPAPQTGPLPHRSVFFPPAFRCPCAATDIPHSIPSGSYIGRSPLYAPARIHRLKPQHALYHSALREILPVLPFSNPHQNIFQAFMKSNPHGEKFSEKQLHGIFQPAVFDALDSAPDDAFLLFPVD